MPLSEEELRLLEQMERGLEEEDPKFASTLRGTSLRRSARRRAIVSGTAFVGGVVLLVVGASTPSTLIGLAGFVVMLGSATVCVVAIRSQQNVAEAATGVHPSRGGFTLIDGGRSSRGRRFGRSGARAPRHSFMERIEERWRRRRDDGAGW